jgi:hypothetical protein
VRAKSAILVIATASWLSACYAPPPLINSTAFERRAPLSGQPGYLETIEFIDDGVRYIDPSAQFFVSPDGEMCFRGLVNRQQVQFETYTNFWCISPYAVSNVDALENNVSFVNEVRLWCRHADPQCAHRVGSPDFLDTSPGIANSILVQVTPFRPTRAAVEHLVYLMGGNASDTWLLRRTPPVSGAADGNFMTRTQ